MRLFNTKQDTSPDRQLRKALTKKTWTECSVRKKDTIPPNRPSVAGRNPWFPTVFLTCACPLCLQSHASGIPSGQSIYHGGFRPANNSVCGGLLTLHETRIPKCTEYGLQFWGSGPSARDRGVPHFRLSPIPRCVRPESDLHMNSSMHFWKKNRWQIAYSFFSRSARHHRNVSAYWEEASAIKSSGASRSAN